MENQELSKLSLADLYRIRRQLKVNLMRVQWKIQTKEKNQRKKETKTDAKEI
jgi:hypothetical protein